MKGRTVLGKAANSSADLRLPPPNMVGSARLSIARSASDETTTDSRERASDVLIGHLSGAGAARPQPTRGTPRDGDGFPAMNESTRSLLDPWDTRVGGAHA